MKSMKSIPAKVPIKRLKSDAQIDPQDKKNLSLITWELRISESKCKTLALAKSLREVAKHWVFQLERGEEKGYLHYQIRISLYKKKRRGELLTLLNNTALQAPNYCQPTSTPGTKTFDYVMKKDTRVEGPWTEKDPDPEQIDDELLFPPNAFQTKMLELIKGIIDRRKISVVVDPKGNRGKTWLLKYVRYHKLGTVIPTFNKMEDISQMVMCKPVDRCYMIDMPRSIKPNKMQEFWSGIEQLKNGYCYDKRNSFKDRQFRTPHVIVLTNKMPDKEMLSEDRWDIIIL